MLARTKALTWLAEYVKKEDGNNISADDFYLSYFSYCSKNGIVPATKIIMGKLVGKLFCNSVVKNKKKFVYEGLKIIDIEKVKDIKRAVPELYKSEHCNSEIVLIPTRIIVNDNHLKFSITQSVGNIKVSLRGDEIDIDDIGFCSKSTPQNMKTLVRFAPSIQLCQGKEFDITLVTQHSVIERLQAVDDVNSTIKIIRSKKCSQVLSYLATSNMCYHCYIYFYQLDLSLRSKDDTSEQVQECEIQEVDNCEATNKKARLTTYTDCITEDQRHICFLINLLNPNRPSPPECPCKIILNIKQKSSGKTNHKPQKWDKKTISASLTLWGRNPQAYANLLLTCSLTLPSVHFLESYKNYAKQRPGFSVENLERMAREAERAQLTECGERSVLSVDEITVQDDTQNEKESSEAEQCQGNEEGLVDERRESLRKAESLQFLMNSQSYDFMKHPSGLQRSSIKCYSCKKPFITKEEVLYHEITHMHTSWVQCGECSEEFDTKSHLQVHMRKHPVKTSYKCKNCSWQCMSKNRVVDHIISRHKQCGYFCYFCSVRCVEKDFTVHLEQMHSFRSDDCLLQLWVAGGSKHAQPNSKEQKPLPKSASTQPPKEIEASKVVVKSSGDQHQNLVEGCLRDRSDVTETEEIVKDETGGGSNLVKNMENVVREPVCIIKEEDVDWGSTHRNYKDPEIKVEQSENELLRSKENELIDC